MTDSALKKPAIGYACHDTSGKLSPFDFKRRETGPKDVTFTVKFCGMCHSDLHAARNEWGSATYPMVPGHEIVGVVTEVGSKVSKFKVGDEIGVGCMVNSCRECDNCKHDFEQYCTTGNTLTYGAKDVDGTITYGGYSNFMVVNEDYVLKMPKGLPLDAASPLLCAGITVYSPMKYYGMDVAGKEIGIIGLGGLGSMAAKFAKAFGMKLTVISTSPKKEKEARAGLGADHFIVSKDENSMKAAAAGLDFIIDTVSAPHPVEPYLSLLKVNGKYVLVGVPPHVMEISPTSLIFGRKLVAGSLIGGIKETQEMLDFCAKHNIVCEIEKIPMEYVNTAMDRLQASDVHYRFVIDVENTLKPQV